MSEVKSRDSWVDFAKLFACFLVAIGHLLMSFAKSEVVSNTNELFLTFKNLIYLFHVPVFFFCSGYLYQKTAIVNSFKSYLNNILKRGINLGVVYFTFYGITILLKVIFSSSVNTQIDRGIFNALFFHPISPYWFLVALFFIFLVCPTAQSIKSVYGLLAISLVLKISAIFDFNLPYPLNYVQNSLIWFALGISFFIVASKQKWFPLQIMQSVSKYTMHIFVLHTIAASMFRIILLKIGIYSLSVHVIVRFFASIAVPIAVGWFCQKFLLLNFFFEPFNVVKRLKGTAKLGVV